MRYAAVGIMLVACLSTAAHAQKRRSSRSSGKGVPCGRSYISADKVCHIDTPSQPRNESSQAPATNTPANNTPAPASVQAFVSRVPVADGGRRALFVGSAMGTTYYPVSGCDSAAAIPDSLRVYFASEAAAQLLRYHRVTRCF